MQKLKEGENTGCALLSGTLRADRARFAAKSQLIDQLVARNYLAI